MTQRAIDGPYIYFVTTNTTFRRWVFDVPEKAEDLGNMIREIAAEKQFDLFAYCILPNHLHMLTYQAGLFTLSKFMNYLKGRFSVQDQSGRLWQPRFNFRIVEDEQYFFNVLGYIIHNYQKHELEDRFGRPPYVFVDWEKINTIWT